MREFHHKQYLERKKGGRCVRCGKKVKKTIHCRMCLDKLIEYKKKCWKTQNAKL